MKRSDAVQPVVFEYVTDGAPNPHLHAMWSILNLLHKNPECLESVEFLVQVGTIRHAYRHGCA